MLRRCLPRRVHSRVAESRMQTVYEDLGIPKPSLRQRIRRWPLWKKISVPLLSPVVTFLSYVGVATLIHRLHRPTIDKLFDQNSDEVVGVEEWASVEPTLREGDIVLLMGTGSMSWKITNSAFVIGLLRPAMIRYSHVGVIVKPAELEAPAVPKKGSRSAVPSQPKVKRGALMLEAVDNTDVNCPDRDGLVRHNCVQVVEASRRIFGQEGERRCYHRLAIRRLQGFEWTPERRAKLNQFVDAKVGQKMDKSPKLMVAFISPKLYKWMDVRKNNEISCSELIADMYKAVGIIQRRKQWGKQRDDDSLQGFIEAYDPKPSIEIAPCHFAQGVEKGVLDFAPGVGLGPEVRMPMIQPPPHLLYTQ